MKSTTTTVNQKPILTTFDIAKLLSVDITTVMMWVDQGKIPAYKTPGGHRRVFKKDFMDFVKKFNIPFQNASEERKPTILIVDDDSQIIRVLTRFLKKISSSFQIETAMDGFEAGQKCELVNPDIVLLDLNLPGIDGYKICKNIRMNPTHKNMVVLAISGFDSTEKRNKIREAGADGFFSKPFDFELLKQTILKYAERIPMNHN